MSEAEVAMGRTMDSLVASIPAAEQPPPTQGAADHPAIGASVKLAKRIGREIREGEARGWDLIAHSEWTPAVFIAIAWAFILAS